MVIYKQKTITKRLLAEIPMELHREICEKAAKRNITIKTYIMQAINERLIKDRLYEK